MSGIPYQVNGREGGPVEVYAAWVDDGEIVTDRHLVGEGDSFRGIPYADLLAAAPGVVDVGGHPDDDGEPIPRADA